MSHDIDFVMTYPCYFLFGESGGLQCNTVDGKECLCLFTSKETVQRFHQILQHQLHGPHLEFLMASVDECPDYDGLMDRLKSGEAELAASGIGHIVIDPVPGRPVCYAPIRDFIEQLLPE